MVQRDREGWQLTMILCHLSHLARGGGGGILSHGHGHVNNHPACLL